MSIYYCSEKTPAGLLWPTGVLPYFHILFFSVLIRALPLLLRSRQPSKPYLDVLFDRLHRSLKSEAFTVEAQVIVAGICPLLPGVVTVEITAVLVGPLHKFLDCSFPTYARRSTACSTQYFLDAWTNTLTTLS